MAFSGGVCQRLSLSSSVTVCSTLSANHLCMSELAAEAWLHAATAQKAAACVCCCRWCDPANKMLAQNPSFSPLSPGAKVGALEITPDNRQLLKSDYTRRRPEELAVLTR